VNIQKNSAEKIIAPVVATDVCPKYSSYQKVKELIIGVKSSE
jgi:hypothetical protein